MNETLKKILYVDDEQDIRMIATMVLEKKAGIEVIPHESGASALDYIKGLDHADTPDLILLDVMMPGMDGPQTLEHIKEHDSHPISDVPIVFLTAKCQPYEVERLKSLGATDVIAKPFDVHNFSEQLITIYANQKPT